MMRVISGPLYSLSNLSPSLFGSLHARQVSEPLRRERLLHRKVRGGESNSLVVT